MHIRKKDTLKANQNKRNKEYLIMSNFESILSLNTDAVTSVVITGTISNGIIIYSQMKKPSFNETDIYILALACVDLFACTVMCPQYPFLDVYIEEYNRNNHFALRQLFTCASFFLVMYLGLLTAIALNRVMAVFRPHSYISSVKRSKIIVAVIFCVNLLDAITSINLQRYLLNGYIFANLLKAIQILLCLCLMIICYLSIVVRLQRQKRKVENRSGITTEVTTVTKQVPGPSTSDKHVPYQENKEIETATTSTMGGQIRTPLPLSPKVTNCNWKVTVVNCNSDSAHERATVESGHKKRKTCSKGGNAIHLKTLKMFFTMTALFMASFLPLICIFTRLTNHFYVAYTTFINANANFVVYLCFNADFRKVVFGIAKRIKSLFVK